MGLFDWFRKAKQTVPLPELCYDVAYFILPRYAFGGLANLPSFCVNKPTAAGPFFYFRAAQARNAKPDDDDAKLFRWALRALLPNALNISRSSTRCLRRSMCRASSSASPLPSAIIVTRLCTKRWLDIISWVRPRMMVGRRSDASRAV